MQLRTLRNDAHHYGRRHLAGKVIRLVRVTVIIGNFLSFYSIVARTVLLTDEFLRGEGMLGDGVEE